MTTYHTKEWHAWSANPRQYYLRRTGVSVGIFLVAIGLMAGGYALHQRQSPLRAETAIQLALCAPPIVGVLFYQLVEAVMRSGTLTFTLEGIESRWLGHAHSLRWADCRTARLSWNDELPSVEFVTGRRGVRHVVPKSWVPPREVADRVLLAIATYAIPTELPTTLNRKTIRSYLGLAAATVSVLSFVVFGTIRWIAHVQGLWVLTAWAITGGISVSTAAVFTLRRRESFPVWRPIWSGIWMGLVYSSWPLALTVESFRFELLYWYCGLLVAIVLASTLAAFSLPWLDRWQARREEAAAPQPP